MPPADAPSPQPAPHPDDPADGGSTTPAAEATTARVPAPRSDVEAVPDSPAPRELSERELEILAFERRWWKHAGSKEQAIRDTFDLSATRYYQLLNGLLDNPAALAHDALLVGRLRRLRSTRARVRRR